MVCVICEICKKEFLSERITRKTCSKSCRDKKFYSNHNEQLKQRTLKYHYNNREASLIRMKKYNLSHQSQIIEYRRKYWIDKKEILTPKKKAYYEKNKEWLNQKYYQQYKKPRYHSDENFRLKEVLSARVRGALGNNYKGASTLELIGCTIPELKQHIESLWETGMSWNNYGINGWHIDHIIPCDYFDLKDVEQQKKCFNWRNLQPLWAIDNIRKSNNLAVG